MHEPFVIGSRMHAPLPPSDTSVRFCAKVGRGMSITKGCCLGVVGAVASWFMLSLRFAKGLLGGPQLIALNAVVISCLHEMVRHTEAH